MNDGNSLYQRPSRSVKLHHEVLLAFVAAILLLLSPPARAEPIVHVTEYPSGDGPFPVVIALHSSGGFHTVKRQIPKYVNAGYAVYAPDFFHRHGLSHSNRFETWTTYRTAIEQELLEIIEVIKKDPKADPKNLFAVGFSNGGYWASFLAAKRHVNAAASHYGVWSFPRHNGYPADYFDNDSNPVLAIHGDLDSVQVPRFVYPQLEIAESKSAKFKKHLFTDAGHSWDCKPCKADGYDHTANQEALKLTLELFRSNTK